MRLWLPALTTALVIGSAACANDAAAPDSGTGTLVFKLDPASCVGHGTLELYVDGVSQGQYLFNAGDIRSFSVLSGAHTVAAQEIGGNGWSWPTQTVFVDSDATMTELLKCT